MKRRLSVAGCLALVASLGGLLYWKQLSFLSESYGRPVASMTIGAGKVHVAAFKDRGQLYYFPILGLWESGDTNVCGYTYVFSHRCGTNRFGVDLVSDLPLESLDVLENGLKTYVMRVRSTHILAEFDCSPK